MAIPNRNVERCVETLCNQGCERVSASIEVLRAGELLAEVAELSVAERQLVLDELVAIMATYDGNAND